MITWGSPDNPGEPPHLKILNAITPAESLLPWKVTSSQAPGSRRRTLLGSHCFNPGPFLSTSAKEILASEPIPGSLTSSRASWKYDLGILKAEGVSQGKGRAKAQNLDSAQTPGVMAGFCL